MGTRLAEMGYDLQPPLWSASVLEKATQAVFEVHWENISAGARIITTNTFRTTPYTFHRLGLRGVEAHHRARILSMRAIHMAHQAVQRAAVPVQVAASITDLEDCYRPQDYPGNVAARPWHDAQLDILDHPWVDLFLLETMNSRRETLLLAELALDRSKPVWVSFVLNEKGEILRGDDLVATARRLEQMGVAAIGINCSPLEVTMKALARLREAVNLPIMVYPNLGYSERDSGLIEQVVEPEQFADWAMKAAETGADIIGACCGSRAEHIAAVQHACHPA